MVTFLGVGDIKVICIVFVKIWYTSARGVSGTVSSYTNPLRKRALTDVNLVISNFAYNLEYVFPLTFSSNSFF